MSAPVDGLCRTADFTFTRADDDQTDDDGLTLEGYAAVFDEPTTIDSWEGTFIERIRKGAFRKTLRERTPVLQFEHGRHPLIGSIPIGRLDDAREDDTGVAVMGRLSDNWLIEPVRDAIRDRAVTKMSFRFDVIRQEWRDNKGKIVKPEEMPMLLWDPGDRGPLERTLIEVRVHELGPVVFPAYEGTSVGVRAAGIADTITREDHLRRDVLRALATEPPVTLDEGLPEDPELRSEVARAVLFGASPATAKPLADEHPAEDGETRTGENDEYRTTGTPPEDEHLPAPSDAPPDAGHPSPSDRESRARYARLAYVTREGVGKHGHNDDSNRQPAGKSPVGAA